MTYELIENLMEKLSCDFVMATPEEPETLSSLLPILKQIHGKCMGQPLNGRANDVLKAKRIIHAVLTDNSQDVEQKMADLGELISNLLSFISALKESDRIAVPAVIPPPGPARPVPDPDLMGEILHQLSSRMGEFCPGEIPDLGDLVDFLEDLIELSKENKTSAVYDVAVACRGYVEQMMLGTIQDTRPLEEGIVLLKSLLGHFKKGKVFSFDYSDVMALLNMEQPSDSATEEAEPKAKKNDPAGLEKISDEDLEILADFVSEAEENLDTIEINLVHLEQDPSNKEIINEIFRPFHSIKGVSGFLSLTKINRLAHITENLLDSARSGDFIINDMATDAILTSVDTLKKLLSRVKQGVAVGFKQPDDDIDVDALSKDLQNLQIALIKGKKMPLGEILIQKGDISFDHLEGALEIQKQHPEKKIGEILVEEKKVMPGQIASALMEQNLPQKQASPQVKVSTDKLDDLVDYAGELVIAQSMLRQRASKDPSLSQSVAQLGQIVTNMQKIAMSMRMIPIKSTFMKMIRLVRDLSRKSGKEVALTMAGEETEIDRNIVDALYEPMVHMIRNSVDHGIEQKSDRLERGKPSCGSIHLRAYHKGGHIIIEIEDDGKGLDKDRILEKAKLTGLITGKEQMTDAQLYDLILQPGFSTAEAVTDVSGRGVGMDVVKNGIEKFRGHLNIESSKGAGTKFTISLPLTLAIIDGMLVRVGDEKYVIPTMAIQKAFKPGKAECFTVEGKGEMVRDRGHLIPVIRLNTLFKSGSRKKRIWDSLVMVVESKGEKRALLIDELLGKDEYVIKRLGSSLEEIEGLAGGAILSDGRVGLILDIHGIFSLVLQSQ